MKSFLKNLLLFALPIVVISLSLECIVRHAPNVYKYKYQWMQENVENVETLVLGNSHLFYAVQPKYLSGVSFNLACPNQRLENDLSLLNYWSNRFKNLKTIVCNISYFTWFTPGIEIVAPDCCRYYNLYMDSDLYNDCSFNNNFEISNPKQALLVLKAFILNEHTADGTCDELGNSNLNTLSNKDMKQWEKGEFNKTIINHHTFKTREYVPQNYSYLEKIADYCQKRNVRLVLVTPPAWESYYNNLDNKQLEDMYNLVHKLQKEYNIFYLDYLKDNRFGIDNFYNESHMSYEGATKFTKILNEDINSLPSLSSNISRLQRN